VSRQEPLKSSEPIVTRRDESEDFHLHIDLRLELDQIADLHAEQLRLKSRRPPTRKELVRLACRIYDARRARDRMFDRKLFGEPAWDMLLALYCLPARGERLGVTSLTHAANVAQATGHRWQAILTEHGLIERGPPELDARRQLLRLTEKGRKLLENYLTRLFYCDTPMPPYPEAAGG